MSDTTRGLRLGGLALAGVLGFAVRHCDDAARVAARSADDVAAVAAHSADDVARGVSHHLDDAAAIAAHGDDARAGAHLDELGHAADLALSAAGDDDAGSLFVSTVPGDAEAFARVYGRAPAQGELQALRDTVPTGTGGVLSPAAFDASLDQAASSGRPLALLATIGGTAEAPTVRWPDGTETPAQALLAGAERRGVQLGIIGAPTEGVDWAPEGVDRALEAATAGMMEQ